MFWSCKSLKASKRFDNLDNLDTLAKDSTLSRLTLNLTIQMLTCQDQKLFILPWLLIFNINKALVSDLICSKIPLCLPSSFQSKADFWVIIKPRTFAHWCYFLPIPIEWAVCHWWLMKKPNRISTFTLVTYWRIINYPINVEPIDLRGTG